MSLVSGSQTTTEGVQATNKLAGMRKRGLDMRRDERGSETESDSEEPPRKRYHERSPSPLLDSECRTLACPFYKFAPGDNPHCAQAKLTRISYVKQHVQRRHQAPAYCRRCYKTFKREEDLDRHAQALEACRPSDARPIIGITAAQKELLARRSDQNLNEEGQWFNIWKILFPKHKAPVSPYIDLDLPPEVNSYQDFIANKVPERLQDMVDTKSPKLSPFFKSLVAGIPEVLIEISEEWKEQWRSGRRQSLRNESSEREFGQLTPARTY
jgi:hypothetical protein